MLDRRGAMGRAEGGRVAARRTTPVGQSGEANRDADGDHPPEAAAVALAIRRSRERHPDTWAALARCASFVAYTDGSAPVRNPGGPAGFAAIVVGQAGGDAPKTLGSPRLDVGGYIRARKTEPKTSNNRAEIAGILAALTVIGAVASGETPATDATIYSDSEYAIRCATGVWKRAKNTDLWALYDEAAATVRRVAPSGPRLVWVRGHAGNELNEAADDLATRAALQFDAAAYARYRAAQASREGDAPIASALDGAPARSDGATASALIVLHSHVQGPQVASGFFAISGASDRRIAEDVRVGAAPSPDAAEYQTLIAALTRLLEELRATGASPRDVRVRIESQREVVVRQLAGRYAVKAPTLQPLFATARDLLGRFGGFDVAWLPSSEMAARLASARPA